MTLVLFGLTAIAVTRPLSSAPPSSIGLGPMGVHTVPSRLMGRVPHPPQCPGPAESWHLDRARAFGSHLEGWRGSRRTRPRRAAAATAALRSHKRPPMAVLRLQVGAAPCP